MFVLASEISWRKCTEDSPWSDRLILFDCPLFARKFPPQSALVVKDLLLDCNAQLDILACQEARRRRLLLTGLASNWAYDRVGLLGDSGSYLAELILQPSG